MRILIYTHEFPPFLGGLATTSYKLAEGISLAGYDLAVLAPDYPELKINKKDAECDFQIIRMNRLAQNHGVVTPIKELTGFYYLRRVLSQFEPDRLILITREAHFAGGLLMNFPEKLIARVAGYEAYRYLLGKKIHKRFIGKIMKRLYMNCDKVVCPSKATRELLIEAGIPENKTQVIYNGVNSQFTTLKPRQDTLRKLRDKFSIKDNEKVILTVSRLVPGKGQDQTIKALYEVDKRFNDFKYLLVGDGSYENNLRELVGKLGLKNKVVFVGPISHDEVIDYFDLCDVFVLANRVIESRENIEGLPNVVLEALCRAKPVISGMPGGAKEIVENDETGYVVDGNVVSEIADKLLVLLENPRKAQEFGLRAKNIIDKNFTERQMIEQYIALL